MCIDFVSCDLWLVLTCPLHYSQRSMWRSRVDNAPRQSLCDRRRDQLDRPHLLDFLKDITLYTYYFQSLARTHTLCFLTENTVTAVAHHCRLTSKSHSTSSVGHLTNTVTHKHPRGRLCLAKPAASPANHRKHVTNRNINQHPATPRRRPGRLLRHPLVPQQTPTLSRQQQQQQFLPRKSRRRPRASRPSQRHVPPTRPPQHSLGPAPQRRQRGRHLGAHPDWPRPRDPAA